jgi:hypothetical protein
LEALTGIDTPAKVKHDKGARLSEIELPVLRGLLAEHVTILSSVSDDESARRRQDEYRVCWTKLRQAADAIEHPHPFLEVATTWHWVAIAQAEGLNNEARQRRLEAMVGPFVSMLDERELEAELFSIEVYERYGNPNDVPYMDWFRRDITQEKRIAVRKAIDLILRVRGKDVVDSEWGKNLGQGLYEFRIRHTAAEIEAMWGRGAGAADMPETEDILIRVYFHPYGDRVVLLLAGFDKGTAPENEDREIARARTALTDFLEQEKRRAKEARRAGSRKQRSS